MDGSIWIVAVIAFLALVFLIVKAVDASHSKHAASVDLSSLPQLFIVFDLETTGLDPTRHEIVEIGAILVNRDSDVHETFQSLVKPLNRIPEKITQMTGISQNMVDHEGEPLGTVLRDFAAFIEAFPLVSFNAEFDMAFLRKAAKQHDVVIRNRVSCALEMARRAWPGRESYRLCDLAKDGNLSDEDTHRAPWGL